MKKIISLIDSPSLLVEFEVSSLKYYITIKNVDKVSVTVTDDAVSEVQNYLNSEEGKGKTFADLIR